MSERENIAAFETTLPATEMTIVTDQNNRMTRRINRQNHKNPSKLKLHSFE